MAIYKCKICGGSLDIQPGESITTCEYCGTKQTLPRLDDEKRANLYDRANHFRRNNDYDKAMGIYETILNEDTADAEAYWSILLCKYGIEYVEDPLTHKHMPTVNRTQYTSIFDDEDYKSALQYADGYQRELYEAEANSINKIQKEILAISQKEEPFDVFICYKETDSSGRRTQDSVLATELYHELTREGFKVFFSRITLEDKLGQEYEPYIFAALNSAKVMVVLGTKPEYFNAVWVKNEWNRYLSLIKNGARKALIPAYKNMDPYDLPDEFSHLQAQDMSKLGFMQDLIRGIKKLTQAEENKATSKETVVVNANTNISPLLKRAFMFLEDGDFDRADEFCEQVLNIDPECAEAYLGKLMAELNVRKQEDLADCEQSFENNNNYNRVLRFADDKLSKSLKGYILGINERNKKRRLENIYLKAVSILNSTSKPSEFEESAQLFSDIKDYKDSEDLEKLCKEKAETARKDEVKYKIYNEAKELINDKDKYDMLSAIKLLKKISGWKDTDELIAHCQDKIKEIEAREEENRLNAERKREELRVAEEKAAKKRRKIIAISASIVCVMLVFWIALTTAIIPNIKLDKAMELISAEKYAEAYNILLELDNYKNSRDILKDIRNKAQNEFVKNATIGETVKYGSYEQDNDTNNGTEEIEWIILDKSGSKLFMISKYCLDYKVYNTIRTDITWEKCSLREWLNNDFLNDAFDTQQQKTISQTLVQTADNGRARGGNSTQDYLFLLSIEEINTYFPTYSTRQAFMTEYGYRTWNDKSEGSHACWSLRSPGYYNDLVTFVNGYGEIDYSIHSVDFETSVRPAMWIDLSKIG